MNKEHEAFYQTLRRTIREWTASEEGKANRYVEFILLVPDFFNLLVQLTLDPDVSVKDKAKVAAAIAYFISPIDLIPEGIVGPIGYIDDIGVTAYVLNNILQNTPEEVLLRHWENESDLLVNIQSILQLADEMIGSGLWQRLRKMF